METPDDRPRLGPFDVDRQALAERGMALVRLADQLGVRVEPSGRDAPSAGWRVLSRHRAGVILLGSPSGSRDQKWWVAEVREGAQPAVAQVLAEPLPLRPSRAEHRRDLELQWPRAMRAGLVPEGFFIDIVNTGATLWLPDGDAFLVVGVLTEPGSSEVSFGWVAMGQPAAVPLAPGDYSRVPVVVSDQTWDGLGSGPYELHATLVGLGLRAAPLPVVLSAEQITQHRVRSRPHRLSPDKLREMLQVEMERLEAILAAGNDLIGIAERIEVAPSDADAIRSIAAHLGCKDAAASAVFQASMRDLRPGNARALRKRIVEARRRRGAL